MSPKNNKKNKIPLALKKIKSFGPGVSLMPPPEYQMINPLIKKLVLIVILALHGSSGNSFHYICNMEQLYLDSNVM